MLDMVPRQYSMVWMAENTSISLGVCYRDKKKKKKKKSMSLIMAHVPSMSHGQLVYYLCQVAVEIFEFKKMC